MQGHTSRPKHPRTWDSQEASCFLPPQHMGRSCSLFLSLSPLTPSDFKLNRDNGPGQCSSHFAAESPWGRCWHSLTKLAAYTQVLSLPESLDMTHLSCSPQVSDPYRTAVRVSECMWGGGVGSIPGAVAGKDSGSLLGGLGVVLMVGIWGR